MGDKDVPDDDVYVKNARTALRRNAKGTKIGVLELSTKAVKFLTADQGAVSREGFSFDKFYRKAEKTETGRGLNEHNFMDLGYYKDKVIPYIKKMLSEAVQKNVDVLYCVATAAYRTAANRNEIIDLIKAECRINVKILSKEEEAKATFTAFTRCKTKNIALDPSANYLMIDQGGGSSELTVFDSNNIIDTYSLDLGTTILKTVMLQRVSKGTSLNKGFKESDAFVQERVKSFLAASKFTLANRKTGEFIIANGSAITQATGKKGNARQHCTTLSIEQLQTAIAGYQKFLKEKYPNGRHLHDMLDGPKSTQRDAVDGIVVSRLGLPMFVEIMMATGISTIVVNGTGLWYGIYFENLSRLNA
jgi:hypothetical protein